MILLICMYMLPLTLIGTHSVLFTVDDGMEVSVSGEQRTVNSVSGIE